MGPSNIFVAHTLNGFGSSSTDTVVKTLALPPGSWLIGAKVEADNASSSTTELACRISTTQAADETQAIDFAQSAIAPSFSAITSLAGPLQITAASGETVFFICNSNAGNLFNPTLYAIQTGQLTMQ